MAINIIVESTETVVAVGIKQRPAPVPVAIVPGLYYTGAYSVTPTALEQSLITAGKAMSGDVTIAAIPDSYGAVTFANGNLRIT